MAQTRRPVRWGLLGTGYICSEMAKALALVPDARLAAVGSRDLERAQAFVEPHALAHPDVRVHARYQSLVDDPQVDVVYIGTPHSEHAAAARLALTAGKPVLCEKPFTLNRNEAVGLVALARERGLFMMEAMWTRFIPAVAEAKRLVDAGEIGEVVSVQADFGVASTLPPKHRVFNPALGGGALLDLGVYPLALASYFLGPVSAAQAVAQLGTTGVDVHTLFNLRHARGGLSQGLCSLRTPTPCQATVYGTAGRIDLQAPFFHSEHLTLVKPGQAPVERHLPRRGMGYAHQVAEVHRCLQQGWLESRVMPLDESVALMGWLDSMRAQIGLRYPGE
ncbi:Gfo/Idh/MocA family protein [Caldimonas brevitalea]|uniref:Dehydrogenase n=1 Tax=Caldimonas brevitalea TaxID=413882 RepID=A0A0G3BFV0_9BURK|nr:Gfo/Idh/MocA family oxidoreductase [Caldimonas brevitalea]AKJ28232.1 dehydrogenase [Caldimonas brevitalea]